jgi:hypothetical protein
MAAARALRTGGGAVRETQARDVPLALTPYRQLGSSFLSRPLKPWYPVVMNPETSARAVATDWCTTSPPEAGLSGHGTGMTTALEQQAERLRNEARAAPQ